MDRQSAMQGSSSGANAAGAATQEWPPLYPGGGWHLQPPEQAVVVDAAFLMELLQEDAPVADQPPEDVDRLSRVIRSLEAEIAGGGLPPSAVVGTAAEHVLGDVDDDGVLEEDDYLLLPDLDSIPGGPCVAEAPPPPFEYWTEVAPPPAVAHAHDMGGWYLDGDGVMVGSYEFREPCYYGYSESPRIEQVYSPLWQ